MMGESGQSQYSNIEEQLRESGVYVSTTVGFSMKPMLRNRRDRVVLVAANEKKLRKWDVPIYRRDDGKYILHRIIAVKSDHYVIRGDNTYAKEYVPHDRVLGYMSEFYRGKRHVSADSRAYRFYAAFWQKIYFLRLPFHKARMLASKIKHKLCK
ncbi:MAG: S26 family signal peptidase [Clostridia bacterium]|nr:S26 family signal peptidase [Clostridia bacterium]